MKKVYVYPLIVYADVENSSYYGLFPDLDLSMTGFTVEETYISAVKALKSYLEFASKMDAEISNPSTFEEVSVMNPRRVVLLSGVEVDADNLVLTQAEQDYKNIITNLLVDKED